jgi:4-hydroxy-3-methylbut-2-enyl diphosphate reductase
VDSEGDIDLRFLDGARRIGVTAGASSPERIVRRIVSALSVLGPLSLTEHAVAAEEIAFALPREVRG